MKVYISLPISGYDIEERKAVANAAKQWLSEMETTGEVITPFEVCDTPGLEYAHCMGRDIEALLGCDLAVFLPGWRDSRGCCLEHHAAEIYNLAIMEVNDDRFYRRFLELHVIDPEIQEPCPVAIIAPDRLLPPHTRDWENERREQSYQEIAELVRRLEDLLGFSNHEVFLHRPTNGMNCHNQEWEQSLFVSIDSTLDLATSQLEEIHELLVSKALHPAWEIWDYDGYTDNEYLEQKKQEAIARHRQEVKDAFYRAAPIFEDDLPF